jgi:hypothetical protein
MNLPSEKELLSVIRRYPDAHNALKRLVEKNCPEELIARDLCLYCGGNPKDIELLRKSVLHQQGRLAEYSRQLCEAAEMVSQSYPWFELFGFRMHVKAFEELPGTLRGYADLLGVLHKFAKKGTGKYTMRTAHLVYLALLIKKLTGEPHFSELAKLVRACQMEYGSSREAASPKSIQKAFNHFRKRNEMTLLAIAVEEEATEIENKGASRRSVRRGHKIS